MVSSEPTSIVPTQPIPAKSLVIKTDKPRPYICATCTRSFARLEHLKRHERSHTKEKPFQCPVCERSFARRDLLLRHKQKLHANVSPNDDTKRNSISGPCVMGGRRASALSATFSPSFSPTFSPPTGGTGLNPLEHELMGTNTTTTPIHPVSFSRSQSFSAVSADSYMPDSAGYHNDFDDSNTINPQMLRQQESHQPPQSVPYQQPVHMGVRRNRRFNSNASSKPFVDSPEYSVASSSLSQFDSPSTVPYQSPPTELSQGTPLTQQHHWAGELGPQGLSQLGMPGFEQSDDFMNSLLNLDDRFEVKSDPGEVAPHEIVGSIDGDAWLKMEQSQSQPSLAQGPIPGFSSSFTSSLLNNEDQAWQMPHHQVQHQNQNQNQNQNQHQHQHHQPSHNQHPHMPPQMSPYQHPPSPMEQPAQYQHQHPQQQQTQPQPQHPKQHQHQHQQRGAPHMSSMPPHSGTMQPPPPPPPPAGLPLEQPTLAPQSVPSIGLQNLPSSQEVRRLVAAFYSNFNTPAHFVQHGPHLASQNMALVMSMAALGALYLNETQTANQIFDLSCDCIRMFSDLNNISSSSESGLPKDIPIWLVQASMLSLYYLMYVGSNHNYERIATQANNLVSLAHRAQLDKKPSQVLDVPAPNASIEEKYKYHVAAERRVRTMYAVFIATSYCEMCFMVNISCDVSALECGSPRPDTLMVAETAEAWWKNPNVRKLSNDTEPFSKYLESIRIGEVLNSTVAPTVLLSLVCALIKQLCDEKATSAEQKEKIIHTWESSWSNSSYLSTSKDDKTDSILSDCAPIASLAMMRIRIRLPLREHCYTGDYPALDNDLAALRLSQPEDLVDAAVYALDAFLTTDEINQKKSKMFFPSMTYLVEASVILSEALAIIEAMAQPLEKHQRLLMRAHKILSQLAESEAYSFASDALFNIRNPQTSLSTMAIRIAIVLLQCNSPVPPLAFDCLQSRLGS